MIMKVIIKRTLEETLRIASIVLVIIAAVAGGYIVGKNSSFVELPTYAEFANRSLITQHLAVFFLINGAILMGIVSSECSGLIAGEVHEGTIRILVSKPNSRAAILRGKIIGMFLGSFILMILGLSVFYLTETLVGSFDGSVMKDLLSYYPAYILYGLIVIRFFSSLATLLSCLAKKRVIALLPMMFIIIAVLAIPVIIRFVLEMTGREGYPSDLLYIADLNYHFGSLFHWCCDLCGGIKGTSSQLTIPSMLMNIFTSFKLDPDITHKMNTTMIMTNNFIPKMVLLAVYGALTIVNYLISFVLISRKDV